jgi:glycosyltransferase involved in cell wall biosynthesis
MLELEKAGCEVAITSIGANWVKSGLRVAQMLSKLEPAIVQTHFVRGYTHVILPFLARRYGVRRLLAMVHSIQYRQRAWRRIAFNRYDCVIGVSQAVAKSLIAIGTSPELVRSHYLGLFGERSYSEEEGAKYRNEFGIPNDATVVGCIAFDSKVKGVDILLEALANIANRFPTIHLLIIGIDPTCSSLPGDAMRLGIGPRTHWAGLREDGWRLLNASNLYAQPSRSEAMPFAVMEAMALKLPVIATSVGGLSEIVVDGETGILAEPKPLNFAEAIEKMFRRPQDWRSMGNAGHARYLRYFKGEQSVESFIDAHFCSEKQSRSI